MIILRDATEAERRGHVRSSWLSVILPTRGHVPPSGFFRSYRRGHRIDLVGARLSLTLLVDHYLAAPEVRVLVAELATVPGEILGWVAYDDERVHLVRVPGDYARKGLGRVLLARAGHVAPGYRTAAGDALVDAVSLEGTHVEHA